MNKVISLTEYKVGLIEKETEKLNQRIIKRAENSDIGKSLKQGHHIVPDNTYCTQCNKRYKIMYSRAIYADAEFNFCSRDCVVAWGNTHSL